MGNRTLSALLMFGLIVASGADAYETPRGRGRPRPPMATFKAPDAKAVKRLSRSPVVPVVTHPLDPLTANEIATVVTVLTADPRVPREPLFPNLALREPPKKDVLGFSGGSQFTREVAVEVLDRRGNRAYEAIVDLRGQRVVKWKPLPIGTQPAVTFTEYELVDEVVRSDERWQAAMRKRGVQDLDGVYLDGWVGGDPAPGATPGTRTMRLLSFFRGDKPNPYTRPIEGVVVAVDLNRLRVIQVTDTVIAPIAEEPGSVPADAIRSPSPPLVVQEPEGPNYALDGQEIDWDKWRFRYALHPREGLVLYTVQRTDQRVPRSVLYRASLSEIFVPYGVPDPNWAWRFARDVGEYGCGRNATALQRGIDVPSNATLIDVDLADDAGGVTRYPSAVAVYERYGEVLWSRVDPESIDKDARMGRELVLASQCWIGNYLYGLRWVFRQDASIKVEVDLTGTLLMRGVPSGMDGNEYGTAVARYLSAPDHQHFLAFRLDFDVDGQHNGLVELNTRSVRDRGQNPFGNSFVTVETSLKTELQARRRLDIGTNRYWKVFNPSSQNALGQAAGYSLWPGDTARPYQLPVGVGHGPLGFQDYQVWATAYDPEALYAAGQYPNQALAIDGLPVWSNDNGAIDNQDLVLWYTAGLTHHPRPEEQPVMSTHRLGFLIRPEGFLPQNPALDLPPLETAIDQQ